MGIVRAFLVLACLLPAAVASAQTAEQTGDQIYASACAACHGVDGRGVPQERLGFDTPVPGFSDCSFASPETAADRVAVVHDGGPARAFDRRMPAFGEALSAEQVELVVSHVRAFCTSREWPLGELNLPRPLFTKRRSRKTRR